jgi:hypothetical protein
MRQDKLTDAERAFIDTLPGPPPLGTVRTTNIWIIEWLSPEERHTGRELHDWLQGKRPGWSIYCPCATKADVFAAIKRAQICAQNGMVPVLHLEAHGGDDGIAPSRPPHRECMRWEELTEPLQRLNLTTRCNLIVVVAACVGFAGVQAFRRGPRAPAVALIGPNDEVVSSELLAGTKELYWRWMDTGSLTQIVESASREMRGVDFEPEPFAIMCFEALVEGLVKSTRPDERRDRVEKLRRHAQVNSGLTREQVESKLAQVPRLPAWAEVQQMWDQMFMIDIRPENKERFGIDAKYIVERIEAFAAELE